VTRVCARKLSIVIICWNDLRVIRDCLHSIYAGTHGTDFEVIVCDNGSTDRSVQFIREQFPQVHIVENGANLGFAKGNNVGIRISSGEYVLILNPDTIIHNGSLDRWIEFADRNPKAGAFGCRVLNSDGSHQRAARPFPSVRTLWMAAVYASPLATISSFFRAGEYTGWSGNNERTIDWQSGCCILLRGNLLRQLGGFDEQFFYSKEEVDLCRRVWDSGYPILFTPSVTITHLGGQSVKRFPVRFVLEEYRSQYRYFYKHHGQRGARRSRYPTIAWLRVRQLGYGLLHAVRPTDLLKSRLDMYRIAVHWNKEVDPVRFVEHGEEPPSIWKTLPPVA